MSIFLANKENTAWAINGSTLETGKLIVYGDVIANNLTNAISRINTAYTTMQDLYNQWDGATVLDESNISISTTNQWADTGETFTTQANHLYELYFSGPANRGFQLKIGTTSTPYFEYWRDYSGGYTSGSSVLFWSTSERTYKVFVYNTATTTSGRLIVYTIGGTH